MDNKEENFSYTILLQRSGIQLIGYVILLVLATLFIVGILITIPAIIVIFMAILFLIFLLAFVFFSFQKKNFGKIVLSNKDFHYTDILGNDYEVLFSTIKSVSIFKASVGTSNLPQHSIRIVSEDKNLTYDIESFKGQDLKIFIDTILNNNPDIAIDHSIQEARNGALNISQIPPEEIQ